MIPKAVTNLTKVAEAAGWECFTVEGVGHEDRQRRNEAPGQPMIKWQQDVASMSLRLARGTERAWGIWVADLPDATSWSYASGGWCDLSVVASARNPLSATELRAVLSDGSYRNAA